MAKELTQDVNFYIPIDMAEIKKSVSGDEKGHYVRGWASTPDLDGQQDIIDPQGIDIDMFLSHGYVNYEHEKDKIVGHPTENSYVDYTRGLYVETKLNMDSPYAREMWGKAQYIAKSGIDRPLGYSVEGYVQRDADNPEIIRKTVITGLALTENPANPKATWEAVMKSLTTGYGITPDDRGDSAGALRIQQASKQLHKLAVTLKEFKKGDIQLIAKSLDEENRYSDDVALLLLQLGYGLSRETAEKYLDKFNKLKEGD